MEKAPTIEEYISEKNNDILDAFCRISVLEYSDDSRYTPYVLGDDFDAMDVHDFLVNSANELEYIQLKTIYNKEVLHRKLLLILSSLSMGKTNLEIIVPAGAQNLISDILQKQSEHLIKNNNFLLDMLDSSEAIITITDNHHNCRCLKYLKVYPNGHLKVVTENLKDYSFDITDIQLEKNVLDKLIQYCRSTVKKRITSGLYIAEDDRHAMDAYKLTYHTKWLGIEKVEYGVDLYDYFKEEHKNTVINKIINGAFIKE